MISRGRVFAGLVLLVVGHPQPSHAPRLALLICINRPHHYYRQWLALDSRLTDRINRYQRPPPMPVRRRSSATRAARTARAVIAPSVPVAAEKHSQISHEAAAMNASRGGSASATSANRSSECLTKIDYQAILREAGHHGQTINSTAIR